MNIRVLLSLLVMSLLCLVPSFLLTGCENDDSPDTGGLDGYFESHPFVSDPRNGKYPRLIQIDPSLAAVAFVGQQISFTASGGHTAYNWDVADSSQGSVVGTGNNRQNGVYTANVVGPNDVIVYDSQGNAAVATISAYGTTLSAAADPNEITFDLGLSTLTAEGGVEPYSWVVNDTALGVINPTTGNSVIYKRLGGGDSGVVVTDAAGNSVGLVIKQPF